MNEERDITVKDFRHLLETAVSTHKLNPENTFVEFMWWDKTIFKPLIYLDRTEHGNPLLVFGGAVCSFYKSVGCDRVFPTGFYINSNATVAENVVCRPYTLKDVFYRSVLNYDDDKMVKFMFSNSPVNYYVQINPFKTNVYKNRNGETILALYADDRDGGEFQPASKVEGKHIALFKDF